MALTCPRPLPYRALPSATAPVSRVLRRTLTTDLLFLRSRGDGYGLNGIGSGFRAEGGGQRAGRATKGVSLKVGAAA